MTISDETLYTRPWLEEELSDQVCSAVLVSDGLAEIVPSYFSTAFLHDYEIHFV